LLPSPFGQISQISKGRRDFQPAPRRDDRTGEDGPAYRSSEGDRRLGVFCGAAPLEPQVVDREKISEIPIEASGKEPTAHQGEMSIPFRRSYPGRGGDKELLHLDYKLYRLHVSRSLTVLSIKIKLRAAHPTLKGGVCFGAARPFFRISEIFESLLPRFPDLHD
jgi:hypothetical protein